MPRLIATARRTGCNIEAYFIDLDNFKDRVNDAMGHTAGDVALRTFGRVLSGSLRRTSDLAARYGGDEFVVFVLNENLKPFSTELQSRLSDGLSQAAQTVAEIRPIGVSIGYCRMRADERIISPDELIAKADAAMYHAKTMTKAPGFVKLVSWHQGMSGGSSEGLPPR